LIKKDTNSYQGIPIDNNGNNSQCPQYLYYVARILWFSLDAKTFPLIGNNPKCSVAKGHYEFYERKKSECPLS
jgi:hypothetical protein